MPPLLRAAWWLHADMVALLLAHGADPNALSTGDATVLMVVAMGLHPQRADGAFMIGALIAAGADPLLTDAEGRTVPEVFAYRQCGDLLEILDAVLARPQHTIVRRRLLERTAPEKRAIWLPRSEALENWASSVRAWGCRARLRALMAAWPSW